MALEADVVPPHALQVLNAILQRTSTSSIAKGGVVAEHREALLGLVDALPARLRGLDARAAPPVRVVDADHGKVSHAQSPPKDVLILPRHWGDRKRGWERDGGVGRGRGHLPVLKAAAKPPGVCESIDVP